MQHRNLYSRGSKSTWCARIACLFVAAVTGAAGLVGVSPATAAAGTALQLNGTSQHATVGTASQLRSATFTVELWFKRTAAGVGTSTGTGGVTAVPLIAKGRAEGETAAQDVNYFFGIDSTTGKLVADFEEAQVAQGGTTPSLNHPITGTAVINADSVWHHAAATYNGTSWNLYLDGTLDGTLSVGRPANALTNAVTAVGSAKLTTGTAAGFFAGAIDEVRIWDAARSQSQIQAAKDTEITSGQPNLLGVWNLNEGTGASLGDSSGNLIAGAAVATPTWVPGFVPPSTPTAPVAVADAYSTPHDTAKVVPAPGVLTNDSDANLDPLTAVLVTNVTHGTLALAANGGFTYTPTAAYIGADSFTYKANDGALDSNTVTVSLTVTGNNALQLNGSSQYATVGTASQLRSATFTVELWFKRTAAGVGTSTGTGGVTAVPLIAKGRAEGETAAQDINYFFGIDSTTGKLVADFEEAQVAQGGTTPSLNHPITGTAVINADSVWHHAAATYNGTSWNLYLDGTLDGTLSVGRPANALTNAVTAVGSAQLTTGTAAGFFAGAIDEVRIWDAARSQSQIQAAKNTEITSGQPNLLGVWNLNEGTGASLGDNSGNLIAGAAVATPTWVPGFVPPAAPNQAPNAPTLNAPGNGSTGIATSPTLDVGASDPNAGDSLTVTYFGRPLASGNFAQIAQHPGIASGTNDTASWTGLGAGQTFEWYATVSDGVLTTTGPTWTFHTVASTDPVFVGVGDIASCDVTTDTDTGNIIQGIDGTVWTTGDNVYDFGTAAEFANCYAPTPWGSPSVKSRTRPIPGNHDWGTGGPETLADYFAYFGTNATDAGGKSYYSYDIPSSNWHIVNLDSECQLVPGGCGVGSAQELWLKSDLAANSSKNVIALWHKPRYSSGATNNQNLQPFWDDLYAAGVDILLDGHDHIYERFAPMKSGATLADPPVADPNYGIRQFTVGTGGEAHHGLAATLPTSLVRTDTEFGIMKLTLHATTYDWKFLPIAGSTFTDSGTGSVHGAPPSSALLRVTTTPAVPSQITVDGVPSDSWGLTWVKTAAGNHTVCFGDVPGFATPVCQNVTTSAGATTVVSGVFTQRGTLRVLTSPAVASTISVDGIPRDDWGMWTDLDVGSHQVCFGLVAGFDPPPCQTVNVAAGATTTVTGTFASNGAALGATGFGTLQVFTAPAVPAQVVVDGVIRDSWGAWFKIGPGSHAVCFTRVEGYTTPSCQTVNVTAGATTTVTGTYTARGFLRVITSPAVAGTVFVDGIARNDWGMWTDIPTGAHQVCFGDVPGLTTPACQNTTVNAGALTTITGTYT